MVTKLWTIGYTGYSLDEFLLALHANHVTCLVDIRELPISRKAGFSKSALREHLEQSKIAYHHFRLLGSPRALRHELRESGDYERFFKGVRQHIASPRAREQQREVVRLARDAATCLMCCCPDWELCHRRCVIEAMLDFAPARFRVEHLQREPVIPRRRTAA